MNIEPLLLAAIADGRVKNLTLFKTSAGWQASISTGVSAWRVRIDPDPVEALRAVLTPDGPAGDIFG